VTNVQFGPLVSTFENQRSRIDKIGRDVQRRLNPDPALHPDSAFQPDPGRRDGPPDRELERPHVPPIATLTPTGPLVSGGSLVDATYTFMIFGSQLLWQRRGSW